ncbi:hypothetical protein HK104_007680, partial [Borealophlyctis nickersoniae]
MEVSGKKDPKEREQQPVGSQEELLRENAHLRDGIAIYKENHRRAVEQVKTERTHAAELERRLAIMESNLEDAKREKEHVIAVHHAFVDSTNAKYALIVTDFEATRKRATAAFTLALTLSTQLDGQAQQVEKFVLNVAAWVRETNRIRYFEEHGVVPVNDGLKYVTEIVTRMEEGVRRFQVGVATVVGLVEEIARGERVGGLKDLKKGGESAATADDDDDDAAAAREQSAPNSSANVRDVDSTSVHHETSPRASSPQQTTPEAAPTLSPLNPITHLQDWA